MSTEQETNTAILKEAIELWNNTKGGSVDHGLKIVDPDVMLRSPAEGAKGLEFSSLRNGRREIKGTLTVSCLG